MTTSNPTRNTNSPRRAAPAHSTSSGITNSAATVVPAAPPISNVSSIRSTPSATHGNPNSASVSKRDNRVSTPHTQS